MGNMGIIDKISSFFGPLFQPAGEWMGDKLKEKLTDFLVEYITVSPIVIVMAAGIYMLVSMVSRTLAKLSVVVVVLYSLAVAVFA